MGRQKGTPKTGGRQKGVPNRNTAAIKDCIAAALSNYLQPNDTTGTTPTLQADMLLMEPAERVRAMAQLAGYVIPKQQAVSIEEQTQAETAALTEWLKEAPDDAVNAIAAKVLELQALNAKA